MNRATFEYVRDRVAHVMAPDPRAIGPAVDLDRRVAISLYVLSTTTEFRNIGHLFGVHKSTVCKFYRRFVRYCPFLLFSSSDSTNFSKSRVVTRIICPTYF